MSLIDPVDRPILTDRGCRSLIGGLNEVNDVIGVLTIQGKKRGDTGGG